jgi:hypothetical protein
MKTFPVDTQNNTIPITQIRNIAAPLAQNLLETLRHIMHRFAVVRQTFCQ